MTRWCQDVASFKNAAQTAKDQEVKSRIGKTLPVLEQHLEQAKMWRGKSTLMPVSGRGKTAEKKSEVKTPSQELYELIQGERRAPIAFKLR